MGYFRELLGQVFGSLLRNKLRSFLTMAGIAWGLASIVIIVAMGDGFKAGQRANMKNLGENIVILFGGRTESQAGGQRAGRRIRLTFTDVEAMRREAYLVKSVAAELEGEVRASSNFNSGTFDVSGVESHFPTMRTLPIATGRFFSDEDEKSARRVCVIGADVKKQLFGGRPMAIGTLIFLNSMPFEIIGLMADKNQNSSYSGLDSKKIFLPYRTMTRDAPPKSATYQPGVLDEIIYVPRSLDDFEEARLQVKKIIGRLHKFNPADTGALGVWDTVENQRETDGIFDSMTAFLAVIAVVTLSLGGIGVMNIMLVTVTERTREIGLRKALGATRMRILLDFLVEGCVLAFASGAVGWSIAFGLSSLLKLFEMPEMFPGLPVSGQTTAYSFGALTVIAIVSSLVPAWRASALTPVEALRADR